MSQTKSSQQVTQELRKWIVDQATAGYSPESVLKSMIKSGWQEDVAAQALEDTLRGYLVDHARANGLPEPRVVPEPLALDHGSVLHAGGREVQVLASMLNPRVLVLGGLLSHDECDEMIELARARLARSETIQ
ncbi:MAG: 2-oxoglutarate-dependent dioxygenase, partial [Ideonella sp.]|nr:2-oxoglutarate-dependent dioxygenase [Ideonella sp.]